MSQIGWRVFQSAIVSGTVYWGTTVTPPVSPSATLLFGILTAAIATGSLAALFRAIRRALGRSTEEDRIWRATPAPRSNLAPTDDVV